jgi:hypothetical protein
MGKLIKEVLRAFVKQAAWVLAIAAVLFVLVVHVMPRDVFNYNHF